MIFNVFVKCLFREFCSFYMIPRLFFCCRLPVNGLGFWKFPLHTVKIYLS